MSKGNKKSVELVTWGAPLRVKPLCDGWRNLAYIFGFNWGANVWKSNEKLNFIL